MQAVRLRAIAALDFPMMALYLILYLAVPVVHAVTTVLAWYISGNWLVGAATFFTPFVAEVYWSIATWQRSGVFLNEFAAMYLGVALIYCTSVAVTYLSMILHPADEAGGKSPIR